MVEHRFSIPLTRVRFPFPAPSRQSTGEVQALPAHLLGWAMVAGWMRRVEAEVSLVRVVVCGGRNFDNAGFIYEELDRLHANLRFGSSSRARLAELIGSRANGPVRAASIWLSFPRTGRMKVGTLRSFVTKGCCVKVSQTS
jgi:hypothetical protein